MRISDWSSDVCSSDLVSATRHCRTTFPASSRYRLLGSRTNYSFQHGNAPARPEVTRRRIVSFAPATCPAGVVANSRVRRLKTQKTCHPSQNRWSSPATARARGLDRLCRSEEHTSELQSLMRISYDVVGLKKK